MMWQIKEMKTGKDKQGRKEEQEEK